MTFEAPTLAADLVHDTSPLHVALQGLLCRPETEVFDEYLALGGPLRQEGSAYSKKLDKPKTADNHACTHTRTRVGGHARTRTLSHAQTQMQEHQRLLQPSIILCKQHSSSAPVHQLSPPSPLVVYVFWALPQILCQGRWPLGTSVGCKGEKKSGRTKHWVAVVLWMQCRRLPSIRMFFWPVTNIKPFVVGGGGNVTLAKRGENAQIEKHTNPQ